PSGRSCDTRRDAVDAPGRRPRPAFTRRARTWWGEATAGGVDASDRHAVRSRVSLPAGGQMAAEHFPVEASHILMFARAIGDPNPAYRDPDSPEARATGGIVAPPTFAMASWQFDAEHPLRPDPARPWFGP